MSSDEAITESRKPKAPNCVLSYFLASFFQKPSAKRRGNFRASSSHKLKLWWHCTSVSAWQLPRVFDIKKSVPMCHFRFLKILGDQTWQGLASLAGLRRWCCSTCGHRRDEQMRWEPNTWNSLCLSRSDWILQIMLTYGRFKTYVQNIESKVCAKTKNWRGVWMPQIRMKVDYATKGVNHQEIS